jgi:hypothetical protein
MKRRNFIQNMSMGAAALYANKLFTGRGDSKSLAVQLYTVREAVAKNLEGAVGTTCRPWAIRASSFMDITELFSERRQVNSKPSSPIQESTCLAPITLRVLV